MTPQPTPRERVALAPNIPVDLALKWTDGINFTGQHGPCARFATVDGRTLFLPEPAAQKLRALKLQPGEPVRICKRQAGRSVEYQIEKPTKEGEQPDGTFSLQKDRPEPNSARAAQEERSDVAIHHNGTAPPPSTKIEHAFRTVVHACHTAQQYAREIGYASMPQFTSQDISRMVVTLVIDGRNSR